jgi:putative pyruvate formate lyase activating enzyme
MDYPQIVSCRICPRNCGVNRYTETGFCGAGSKLKINMAALHHGEEPPISGTRGSGTIFFSHCNLRCVFCQNYAISNEGWGYELGTEALAKLMLNLQAQQAHNINLVTPTHFSPQIADAIILAKAEGLLLPTIWNSSAYECTETLASLEGLVDIYLPDLKFAHGVYAGKYASAPDYPQIAMAAIKAMFTQSGTLRMDEHGIAKSGTILRLLVLPHKVGGVQASLHRLADELGTDISLSLMGQYYPAGKADEYPELKRGITEQEYKDVLDTAVELGFSNIYTQELSCSDAWTPAFVTDEEAKTAMKLGGEFRFPTAESEFGIPIIR